MIRTKVKRISKPNPIDRPRAKDLLFDLISESNSNVSKPICKFILKDFLRRKAETMTLNDLSSACKKGRRIIHGLIIHCYNRREFNWQDFSSFFTIGKFLYNILSITCHDMGYKSFLTYNMNLYSSHILHVTYKSVLYMCYAMNPLAYQFINSSPFYPGPCVPGGIAWSTVSLYKTWHSRIQEIVQAKWKNLSLGKIISVTQAMSYCKTLFISYLLVHYVRRVHLGQKLDPSRDFRPPVISNPYIFLINA